MGFRKDFLWGAASAAAQVEGGWNEGGRSPSIWDVAPKGAIKHDDTCHFACDCYHRWKEDVALMKELGFKSYRFSISWSRIIPEEGVVSAEGVKFYSDFVDELLKNGIEPLVTLYHWDLPLWVHKKGGWVWDGIIDLFEAYTKAVVEALGDRVTYWMTFNEPQVFVNLGYRTGSHAPFQKLDPVALGLVSRNVLMSHGRSCITIRRYAKKTPKVGIVIASSLWTPVTESPEDIERARYDTMEGFNSVTSISYWLDPVLLGKVPAILKDSISQEDMKTIFQEQDFVGLNNYQSRNFADGRADYTDDGKQKENPQRYSGVPQTVMRWNVTPEALYWLPRFVYERYSKPIMMTENGMAAYDYVMLDGKVHDAHRTDFITRYIANLKRAADEGIPVLGYQYWSLFDNFEWALGYDPRFGIIYVDYRDGTRVVKDSAYAYAEIIRSNGENLPDAATANKR